MKIFTLTLFVICSVIYSNAQVSQDTKLLLEAEILPNAEVLPIAIDYKEFQMNVIEANKITSQAAYKYSIKGGSKADSTLLWVSNFIYNSNNQIVERQEFDARRKLLITRNYYYNELNALIKKTTSPRSKRESDAEIDNVYFNYDSL